MKRAVAFLFLGLAFGQVADELAQSSVDIWEDMVLAEGETLEGVELAHRWEAARGGRGGSVFNQDCSNYGGLKQLKFRGGKYCGQVQLVCAKKTLGASGAARGNGQGSVQTVNAPITKMTVRAGSYIDKVSVNGKNCGSSNGGRAYSCNAPVGYVLCAIKGKAGWWMDQWQCGYCKKPQPAGPKQCAGGVTTNKVAGGKGPCYGSDHNGSKHLSAGSLAACVKSCKKYNAKFVEYDAGAKKCDCQKGNTCKPCNGCPGNFYSYQIHCQSDCCKGTACVAKVDKCNGYKNVCTGYKKVCTGTSKVCPAGSKLLAEQFAESAEEEAVVSTTNWGMMSGVAAVVVIAGLGGFQYGKRQSVTAEYQGLIDA